jgi:hypothetical protein
MFPTIAFIVITAISLMFFLAVVFQVNKHRTMYHLTQQQSLNCYSSLLKKRYILLTYLLALSFVTIVAIVVTLYR